MILDMTFTNEMEETYDAWEETYLALANHVFQTLSITGLLIFEVNLISLEAIHKLNRDHRQIDRPTDVISFAFEDHVEGEIAIRQKEDTPRVLGEIFISVEKAKQQSEMYQHSFEREMRFLFIHGLLHLLGYDHQTPEEEESMFALQERLLDVHHS